MLLLEIDRKTGGTIHQDALMYVLDKYVIPTYSDFYGNEYNVSVTLNDGTFLPCVAFRHLGKTIKLEFDNLHEIMYSGIKIRRQMPQDDVQKRVIENILYHQNTISLSYIAKVEKCPYSMPDKFRKELKFYPTHYFLARFNDGSYENFRGSEKGFYEIPFNGNLENISDVFSSKMILQNGEILELESYSDFIENEHNFKTIHFGKPSFVCYFDSVNESGFEERIQRVRNNYRE